ncbi:alpha/beta family hydrolase [Agromyces archimandritae]|uniref:Dienelactone hydrolase family protein n=1 Tax=Agromyces archimandritae TaxID=2781962 RepID=A0A975IPH8_9MICO|nr:dienelactone hydrolase family protein [Agromyces archimandritae]
MEPLRIPVGDGSVPASFTPAGAGAAASTAGEASALLVLAPGAGAGRDHPFMLGLSEALAGLGIATLRFDFPYREAGRRFPDRAPAAIATWRAAVDAAGELAGGSPIWAGGKSFGGRMASMAVADGMPAAGLILIGYPLHPPGEPERMRTEHLPEVHVPTLFLQGTKDPFATPNADLDAVVAKMPTARLEWMPGGGHSFDVAGRKRAPAEVGASLASRVAAFVAEAR